MEVHQHSHLASGETHTARKKWTHYFWEFLMLFLAVFCGFMAENQREHMIEHKREKQFMVSMINDLRLDMAWLDTVNISAGQRIKNIKAALKQFVNRQDDLMPVAAYDQLRKSAAQIMFFSNDGTMTQLKNSGGMRLIRKREVVDKIEAYDRLMRRLEVRRTVTIKTAQDFVEVLNRAFIGKDLLTAYYDSSFVVKNINSGYTRLDKANVNDLINQCIALRMRVVADTTANASIKREAATLVEFIQNKYHLN